MEDKVGFISQFIYSISNFEAYKIFLRRSIGKAVLYLLLISIIFSGISGIKILYEFNTGLSEIINTFSKESPYFVLENGELSVDAEMPYILEETNDEIIIIDTSGQIDQSILDDYHEGVFISKYEMVQKENDFEFKKYEFSAFAGFRISKENIEGWLPYLKWLNFFIIFFGFIFYLIAKFFSAFIVSIGGAIIACVGKYKIEFGNIFKLSIYALTLPIIIKTFLGLIDISIPYFWLIYYGIALFYLWKVFKLFQQDTEEAIID